MNSLDEIAARAELAQVAWEDFQLGIATTRFALEEANNSAEDVKPMLDALKAVEAVHEPILALDYGVRDAPLKREVCTGCGQDDGNWQIWPCPTIRAIREATP